ncbi:3301_t:CDS:2 [Paraglomus occultum]|uniref:3301_t:CDS:1 n=1 Tax=Paraglomus occultum TaxID=144539 RepID=A0A9N9FRE3_9GLOM|nr:3301_t:CDS:2 [Paraglomus occultum]
MVGHTNRKNVEIDFMRRYNTIQALRHLVDGYRRFQQKMSEKLLSGWYAIEAPSLKEENNADIEGTSHAISPLDPHFVNIKLHKKWNTLQIDAAGFSNRFDIDNPLYKDFPLHIQIIWE